MIDRATCTDCGVRFIYRRLTGFKRTRCLTCRAKAKAAKCANGYLSRDWQPQS